MATARQRAKTNDRVNHTSSLVERGLDTAVRSGEVLSVGVVNLVKNTLLTALTGVREVGGELATTGVDAVRGAIRATADIGGDLGAVARHAIRGTIAAAEDIGGQLGGAATTATRGAIKATGDVGSDAGHLARAAMTGTAGAVRDVGGALGVSRRPLARASKTAVPRKRRRSA